MSRKRPFGIGLDLGKAEDFSALTITEQRWPDVLDDKCEVIEEAEKAHYHLRHLTRWEIGTSYVKVAQDVAKLMKSSILRGTSELIVDATGVGAAVVDLLVEQGLKPISITITGGSKVNRDGAMKWNVPKRDLVGVTKVLLQSGRLKWSPNLPMIDTLVDELLKFESRISEEGDDTYGVWREGAHDDLVLALACQLWHSEKGGLAKVSFKSLSDGMSDEEKLMISSFMGRRQ